MKVVLALIALVLGYKAFLDASKEKEGIKLLGQAIGIFVMIVAILAFACGVMKYFGGGGYGKGYCPVSKAAICPLKGPVGK
ncbi:MAG: hypothetical protein ACRENF_03025 [Thermodesulfobacteriota bacterium]